MGQSVVALMYGVRWSELPDGLLDEKTDEWIWYGELADQPRNAYEGDCIGFPVAVSGGHDDSDGDLGETCLLSNIEKVHAEGIADAKEKWSAFEKWLAERKIRLPQPALMLTRDERG